MDHIISSLERWLDIYESDSEEAQDKKLIRCIKNALRELRRYYD